MVLLQDADAPFLRSSYVIPVQLVHVLFVRVFYKEMRKEIDLQSGRFLLIIVKRINQ